MIAPVPRGGGPRELRKAAVPASEVQKGPVGWFGEGSATVRNARQRIQNIAEAERARGLPAMTDGQRMQREYGAVQSEVFDALQDYMTQVTGFKRTAPELGALRAAPKKKGATPTAASILQGTFDPLRKHITTASRVVGGKTEYSGPMHTEEQAKIIIDEMGHLLTMMLLFIGSSGAAGAILEPREAM